MNLNMRFVFMIGALFAHALHGMENHSLQLPQSCNGQPVVDQRPAQARATLAVMPKTMRNEHHTQEDKPKRKKMAKSYVVKLKEELFSCCKSQLLIEGVLERIREILKQNVNINATDSHQRTSLHFAADAGNLPIVRLLLEQGANPNLLDSTGRSALHTASNNGNARMARLLLEYGANPNLVDKAGRSPLSYANNTDLIEMLRPITKKPGTSSHMPGQTNWQITRELPPVSSHRPDGPHLPSLVPSIENFVPPLPISYQQRPPMQNGLALWLSMMGGAVQPLTTLPAWPTAQGFGQSMPPAQSLPMPITFPWLPQTAPVVRSLAAPVPPATALGSNSSIIASTAQSLSSENSVPAPAAQTAPVVRSLAAPVPPATVLGSNSSIIASTAQSLSSENSVPAPAAHATAPVVRPLAAPVPPATVLGSNSSIIASTAQSLSSENSVPAPAAHATAPVVRPLLIPVPPASVLGSNSSIIASTAQSLPPENFVPAPAQATTPVVQATHELVNGPLEQAVPASRPFHNGLIMLIYALKGNKEQLVQIVNQGVAINSRFYPLHEAVKAGNITIVQLLLDRGASLDQYDHEGNTALHKALFEDKTAIALLLISSGAPINSKNDEGKTALMIAACRGNNEVVAQLLQKGADQAVIDKSGKKFADYLSPVVRALLTFAQNK